LTTSRRRAAAHLIYQRNGAEVYATEMRCLQKCNGLKKCR
jgi:hypothetical protein